MKHGRMGALKRGKLACATRPTRAELRTVSMSLKWITDKFTCRRCSKIHNKMAPCEVVREVYVAQPRTRLRCFGCQQVGHKIRQCPERKRKPRVDNSVVCCRCRGRRRCKWRRR